MRYATKVVFSTDDSAVPVCIVYPKPMREHEISDLEEFLAIWLRSLKRECAAVKNEETEQLK